MGSAEIISTHETSPRSPSLCSWLLLPWLRPVSRRSGLPSRPAMERSTLGRRRRSGTPSGRQTRRWWRLTMLLDTHGPWPSMSSLTGPLRSLRRRCWAFSATGAMEGMWKKKQGQLVSMSEQNLIDCGQGGCQGGLMNEAWETAKAGINSEADYPYEARDGQCRFDSGSQVAHTSGFQRVGHSESQVEAAVGQIGYPVSIAVHVGSSFQHYSGGVFSDPSCGQQQPNHGVLVVGYKKSEGTPFWIVKNSWGGSWGSSGYIYAKMGENFCGIDKDPMYPTV